MNLENQFGLIRSGLLVTLFFMVFGVGMGVAFGLQEDAFKGYIAETVDANPQVHDEKSKNKIWRYAQRAHFHSTGISAMSLGLLAVLMFCRIKKSLMPTASVLIGLGGVYPLAWFSMFYLAPTIGRSAAHDHIVTEVFTYVGVIGLVGGLLILLANLLFGLFGEEAPAPPS